MRRFTSRFTAAHVASVAQLPLVSVRWGTSVSPSAPPRHIFNVFNGRMMRGDSPVVRSLHDIGVHAVSGSSELAAGRLAVVDTQRFNDFAAKVRAGEAELPSCWPKSMQEGLGFILKSDAIADAAAHTTTWMTNLELRARPRTTAGVVAASSSSTASPSAGSASAALSSSSSSAAAAEEDELQVELTAEQKKVVELVTKGFNTCISGNAGTGKTVLLRAVRRALVKQGLVVGMCATTGIAGCHVGGATFHHTLGVSTHDEFLKPKNLLKFDAIIIDEISMMTQALFETFDAQLRKATGNHQQPFGGVQIILCGDFLQLGAIPYTPIFRSPVFTESFVCVRLMQQIRQTKNPAFSTMLQELRRGVAPSNIRELITSHDEAFLAPDAVNLLPTNAQVKEANRAELERLPGEAMGFSPIIDTPQLQQTWTKSVVLKTTDGFSPQYFRDHFSALLESRVRIAPSAINFYQLYADGFVLRVRLSANEPEAWRAAVCARFEELVAQIGSMGMGCAVDSVVEDGAGLQTGEDEETLQRMVEKHPVVESFSLKIGARVLLRANLSREFVNGSVGTVVDFVECNEDNIPSYLMTDVVRGHVDRYIRESQFQTMSEALPLIPVVQFGGPEGRKIAIPPWRFTVGGEASTNYYGVTAVCLPLSLAYAFTVHRVQGLTLVGRVHLELSQMWPCEHLLYVAMSRVRTPDQLTMSCFKDEMIVADQEAVAFDEAIPTIDNVTIAKHLRPATWRTVGDSVRLAKGKSSAVQLAATTSAARSGSKAQQQQLSKAARDVAKAMARMQEARNARHAAAASGAGGAKAVEGRQQSGPSV